jgi:transcription elongation factor SPT6
LAYAERFEDSGPAKGQSPEELLRKARMLLSTELGKDPLLRSQMRKLFKEEARVTVEPTERGITKIDENHPYFVSCFCVFRPDSKLIVSRTSNISIRSR